MFKKKKVKHIRKKIRQCNDQCNNPSTESKNLILSKACIRRENAYLMYRLPLIDFHVSQFHLYIGYEATRISNLKKKKFKVFHISSWNAMQDIHFRQYFTFWSWSKHVLGLHVHTLGSGTIFIELTSLYLQMIFSNFSHPIHFRFSLHYEGTVSKVLQNHCIKR